MIMTEQGETGEAITILLVEDDAPTCWRLHDALVKAGYEVRSAGTLGEARSALSVAGPRGLVTDLGVPDGPRTPPIPGAKPPFSHTQNHGVPAPGGRREGALR